MASTPAAFEVAVRPASPYRLPSRNGPDGLLRVRGGVLNRVLHFGEQPVLTRVWRRGDEIVFRAEAAGPGPASSDRDPLDMAIERMRFALAVDDDLSDFYARFKRDALLGPVIRRKPWVRARRRPSPWEALAWAVTRQLIESERAAAIQRKIVWRWGRNLELPDGRPLRDMPGPGLIAGLAPAELQAVDLSAGRAMALIKAAREIAAGRADPGDPASDPRLRRIREVGPWTMQLLALEGRGEHDSLPAGDLNYLKLVGRLAGRGRLATVEEVEDLFAPYEPYRGLAVTFAVYGRRLIAPSGRPLRRAA